MSSAALPPVSSAHLNLQHTVIAGAIGAVLSAATFIAFSELWGAVRPVLTTKTEIRPSIYVGRNSEGSATVLVAYPVNSGATSFVVEGDNVYLLSFQTRNRVLNGDGSLQCGSISGPNEQGHFSLTDASGKNLVEYRAALFDGTQHLAKLPAAR